MDLSSTSLSPEVVIAITGTSGENSIIHNDAAAPPNTAGLPKTNSHLELKDAMSTHNLGLIPLIASRRKRLQAAERSLRSSSGLLSDKLSSMASMASRTIFANGPILDDDDDFNIKVYEKNELKSNHRFGSTNTADGIAFKEAGNERYFSSPVSHSRIIKSRDFGKDEADYDIDDKNSRHDLENNPVDEEYATFGPQPAQSKSSTLSSGSFSDRFPNARELSETFLMKVIYMKWTLISVFLNCGLIWIVSALEGGLLVPLSASTIGTVASVICEIILLASNVLTLRALNDGASAYFGSLLVSERGFSYVVCGFAQALPFTKWSFANQLSLNSPCRSLLVKISLLWMLTETLKILSPISATSLCVVLCVYSFFFY